MWEESLRRLDRVLLRDVLIDVPRQVGDRLCNARAGATDWVWPCSGGSDARNGCIVGRRGRRLTRLAGLRLRRATSRRAAAALPGRQRRRRLRVLLAERTAVFAARIDRLPDRVRLPAAHTAVVAGARAQGDRCVAHCGHSSGRYRLRIASSGLYDNVGVAGGEHLLRDRLRHGWGIIGNRMNSGRLGSDCRSCNGRSRSFAIGFGFLWTRRTRSTGFRWLGDVGGGRTSGLLHCQFGRVHIGRRGRTRLELGVLSGFGIDAASAGDMERQWSGMIAVSLNRNLSYCWGERHIRVGSQSGYLLRGDMSVARRIQRLIRIHIVSRSVYIICRDWILWIL